jgi:hypothetical protein
MDVVTLVMCPARTSTTGTRGWVPGVIAGISARCRWRRRKNGGVTQDSDRWPVTCTTCGASRNGLHDDTPCPSCGSTAKTVHVSFHDEAGVADESFGIRALIDKQRPWQEKWHEVEVAYHAVTEVYSGSASGHAEEWKATALSFFRACHELPDAIAGDPSASSATADNIRTAARGDAALTLVADVDNTCKHGGRDPNKCHAHIGEMSWGSRETPTLTIVREYPDSPVERFDVRDAATAAVQAWRAILSRNGLAP